MRRTITWCVLLAFVATPAQASDDQAVARAKGLLGSGAPTTPIYVVHVTRLKGEREWTVALTDGRSYIRIYDDSDAYKSAAKGDATALAAVLAHEAYHIAHGFAEAPAYAEQLRVLRALGAARRHIARVQRAAELTTGKAGY